MKNNDLNIKNWKQSDILTDSLWLINERDKSGKHKNIYHGNFIPQIPYQLISRYTKQNECVLDIFSGSGTTLYECEKLSRNFIGFDINEEITNYTKEQMKKSEKIKFALNICDNTDKENFEKYMKNSLKFLNINSVQFIFMHPPYFDIVKFSEAKNDLSNSQNLDDFLAKFLKSCENSLKFLDFNRYFALVIGDIYKNSEVIPLSFLCQNLIKQNFKVKLKGIIVKNIEGNRGKLGTGGIWRYRALKNDYYIFKHEYIFVFKKEF